MGADKGVNKPTVSAVKVAPDSNQQPAALCLRFVGLGMSVSALGLGTQRFFVSVVLTNSAITAAGYRLGRSKSLSLISMGHQQRQR